MVKATDSNFSYQKEFHLLGSPAQVQILLLSIIVVLFFFFFFWETVEVVRENTGHFILNYGHNSQRDREKIAEEDDVVYVLLNYAIIMGGMLDYLRNTFLIIYIMCYNVSILNIMQSASSVVWGLVTTLQDRRPAWPGQWVAAPVPPFC